jgi:hypothetical protein
MDPVPLARGIGKRADNLTLQYQETAFTPWPALNYITVLSRAFAWILLKKFCGRCKKELPADSKYLLCGDCHRRVALAEDDREFYENSRVHWR